MHISMHKNRLYIVEGTVPGNYPPPGLFQQSMGHVDEEGRGVRYQSVYSNLNGEWSKDFRHNRAGRVRAVGAAERQPHRRELPGSRCPTG